MIQQPNYAAMTVNERLVTAGLMEAFDKAARLRDRDAMMRLLSEVDLDQPEGTVDALLKDPARYGY